MTDVPFNQKISAPAVRREMRPADKESRDKVYKTVMAQKDAWRREQDRKDCEAAAEKSEEVNSED